MRYHLLFLISVCVIFSSCQIQRGKRSGNEEKNDTIIANLHGLDSLKHYFISNDTSALWEFTIAGCCEVVGIYNPSRYTISQIEETGKLVSGGAYLQSGMFPSEPSDIAALSVDDLDKEYEEKVNYFRNLKIIPVKFWEDLRQTRIHELESQYELQRIKTLAYNDPSVLLNSKFKSLCKEFSDALTSIDTTALMVAWERFSEQRGKENELTLARYKVQRASGDSVMYARMDLLTFGWGNCVNHQLARVVGDNVTVKEFEKLFGRIYRDCGGCD
jgi:hypothetical protein